MKEENRTQNYRTYQDLPLTLSPNDVAAVLGISRMNAYRLCHGHNFPAIRLGKRFLIPRDRFLEWLEQQGKGNHLNQENERK